ncbi:3-oxoacyl-ACP synthase III family protein [Bacillus sp. SN10]|uniref:3-oxoacyl-ACP synthase III family protein n=1 Tax=Bacillus sp. SN10 TaxID=2056493 RepID=UPI000C336755|nr:beta-ketoacyl-ACP synthase 3 [Bacillus sp. SN10]PKJ55112.1 3-oxoacyl-ACP synthase [Bacillus sp. SN10]
MLTVPKVDGVKNGLIYPVGIMGTGIYIPENIINNDYWEERLDTTSNWIVEKTGIIERRHISKDISTSDMCIAAGQEALERCGIDAKDLDAIIIATITPDFQLPSTALIVKEKLKADNAIPLDLTQVACAGVVFGVYLGVHLLQNKQFNNVLVIGADALSRIYNPKDRGSCVFFGDGCGAMVLHRMKDKSMGILSWDIGSKFNIEGAGVSHGGAKYPLSQQDFNNGKHYLYMEGKEVWKEAVRALPATIERSIHKGGLTVSQIDFFAVHQANKRLIQHVFDNLGVDSEKTLFNVHKYGNTGAGTIPTVLHEAIINKKIKNRDLVSLAGIGAGFKWGSLLIRHSSDSEDFE